MTRPWEKGAAETSRAFAAFVVYRDLGPGRTIARAAEKLGKADSTFEHWSAKYSWPKRAEAYDAHLDAVGRAQAERVWKEMKRRHARAGAALVDLGEKELRRLARQLLAARGKGAQRLTARDIAALVEVGTRLERLTLAEDAGKDASAEHAASGGLAVVYLSGEAKDPDAWAQKYQKPPAPKPTAE